MAGDAAGDRTRDKIRRAFLKPARVEGVEGVVADGAIEVHIPGGVAQRIEARPAAEGGGVVAIPEVIQATSGVVAVIPLYQH
jgi:hypothetical protein